MGDFSVFTCTWRFAENQYDCIGSKNTNISADDTGDQRRVFLFDKAVAKESTRGLRYDSVDLQRRSDGKSTLGIRICNFGLRLATQFPRNYVRTNVQTTTFSKKTSNHASIIDFFSKNLAYLIFL